MKPGKKKDSPKPDDGQQETGSQKKTSGQQGAKADSGKKHGLKSSGFYAGMAALVGFISVLVVAAGIYFATLLPAKSALEEQRAQDAVNAASAVFSQKLLQTRDLVRHFADSSDAESISAGDASRAELEAAAIRAMPGARRVVVSKLGLAARDDSPPLPVSFASLDLIRQVEQSGDGELEAFLYEGGWYIQVVMPIKQNTGQIAGTLLVMFGAESLEPDWKTMPAGTIALRQTVAGEARTVISHGGNLTAGSTAATALDNWVVAYEPAAADAELIDPLSFWILAAVGAVISAVLVMVVVSMLIRVARRDVGLVAGYVRATLQGEKAAVPRIRLDLLHSMVVLVGQARKVTKTVAAPAETKKGAPAKARPAAAPQPSAGGSDELGDAEPLFQGDSLDIDMLGEDDDLLGLNDDDLASDDDIGVSEGSMIDIDESIFRAYDIRGVVDQNLSPQVMFVIGQAFGSEARKRGVDEVCVGYDGRYSSPSLAQQLTNGILATGVNVINVGMVPTPVLYFATHHFNNGSGAMITGSHNPSNYNGVKMMLAGTTLAQEDIQGLLKRIKTQNFNGGQGTEREENISQAYLDAVVGDIAVAAPLKVVIDAGNGVAGELGPQLIEELGCDVVPLYCEIDGRFPNHHPDPGKPENLQALIEKVRETGADVGIAFDGDGDRIGVVTGQGKIIWPDRLLMLFARDVVSRNPGADVIFDVKCSRRLSGLISSVGGRPVMWKTGHSLIKAKMKETGALLAGEMSGHIFFQERWYGFDDGLYSAARLLEILGIDERDADSLFEEFPEDVSTPEINIEVGESEKFRIMEQLSARANWVDANVSNIDGIRVEYADGWGLCRASNTTPVLVLRFEAETEDALDRIQETFRNQLLAIDSSIPVPF